MAVGDPALGQIVGRKLERDAVTRQYADAVAAKLSSQVGEDGAFLVELYTEQAAREFFNDGSSNFNAVFFAHYPPTKTDASASSAIIAQPYLEPVRRKPQLMTGAQPA